MKVCIWWESESAQNLENSVKRVLEELGLTDFVQLEVTTNEALKKELQISEDSALIIEEESISFKDMIFEWIVPEDEELKSMFISIIGWGSWWGCGSKDENGSCGTWCAC